MKLLFLGLDGFDPDVAARLIAGGRLPALASIAAAGSLGRVLSTLPPATMPAWATCLTGACPGRHGVFDFARIDGYAVRFGTRRAAGPTFLETMAAAGLRVGSLGFPGRFGRDGLAFHVAGWDTPLDVAARVSPAGLHDRIVGRFGARALRFAAADEHRTSGGGWPDRFAAALRESVGARAALASWLAREFRLDVLAVHFQAADTAGHHLIGTRAMDDVYAAVDEAVGILAGSFEPDAVVAVSDHGMGPASGVVVSINALLERAGFLRNRRSSVRAAAGRVLRRAGLYALPARARSAVVRAAGLVAPEAVESAARFGAIDMPATAAFSDDLTYAPSVRINVRGREPLGTVAPGDRERVAREVADCLRGVRGPDERPLFELVLPREAVYEGPFLDEAPDIILWPAQDALGRLPSLCPPHLRPRMGDRCWMAVPPDERRGRKGGILRGNHRRHGMLAVGPAPRAPAERPAADLRAVASLACAAVGIHAPVPPARDEFAGTKEPRGCAARFLGGPGGGEALGAEQPPGTNDRLTGAERRVLARRLAALGYIDDAW